jgi:hypothetical protein
MSNARLAKQKICPTDECPICLNNAETILHCFFQCDANARALKKLTTLEPTLRTTTYQNILDLKITSNQTNRTAIVISEFLYSVWNLRNSHIFQDV